MYTIYINMMLKNLIIFSIIYLLLSACSTGEKADSLSAKDEILGPDELYIEAKILFDNQNYEISKNQFLELKKLYPLSNEAIQSEIMIGFINYLEMDYDEAIIQFQKIIRKYPSHKNLDYVYYMEALCNYEQITHHGLDGNYNEIAIEAFQQVVNRYPNSQYAKDSRQKIILIKSNKAAKHLDIGRFYLKEKRYTAALNRFKVVIEDYSMTKFAPEALHRMVEAYYEMGMIEEASKTASVLGYNYPDSKWYKYSYNLIKEKNSKENRVFNKFKNLFN